MKREYDFINLLNAFGIKYLPTHTNVRKDKDKNTPNKARYSLDLEKHLHVC